MRDVVEEEQRRPRAGGDSVIPRIVGRKRRVHGGEIRDGTDQLDVHIQSFGGDGCPSENQ